VIQRQGSALQLEMDVRHGRDINILGLSVVFIEPAYFSSPNEV
jgi:hypothetical protein